MRLSAACRSPGAGPAAARPGPHPVGGDRQASIRCWPSCTTRLCRCLRLRAKHDSIPHGGAPTGRREAYRRPPRWPIARLPLVYRFISWEQYLHNRSSASQASGLSGRASGRCLAEGRRCRRACIPGCGRCGTRVALRYSGSTGQYPVYTCRIAYQTADHPRCQEVRAAGVGCGHSRPPARRAGTGSAGPGPAALDQMELDADALRRQWRQRLERARMRSSRARRQYQAVEPEHRLVARAPNGSGRINCGR